MTHTTWISDSEFRPQIRSIINADNKIDLSQTTVRFNLKPHKVFIFNAETEERLYVEVK